MKLSAWLFSLGRMVGFALVIGLACRFFAPPVHPGPITLVDAIPVHFRVEGEASPPTPAHSKAVDAAIEMVWDKDDATVLRYLRAHGATLNDWSTGGETLISNFSRWDDPEHLKSFLAAGADPNRRTRSNATMLEYAITEQHSDMPSIENVRILLRAGADPNLPFSDGMSALAASVPYQDTKLLIMLLRAGARLDTPDTDGTTPLMVACSNSGSYHDEKGSEGVALRFLLQCGANPHARDKEGRPPLAYTLIGGRMDSDADEDVRYSGVFDVEAMKILLAHGADLQARDNAGLTALHWASLPIGELDDSTINSRIRTLRFLLECGLSINARDYQGRTPLMLAVEAYYHSHLEASTALLPVKFLLMHGADPTARDLKGHTVLDRAQREWSMTQLLRSYGAR